MQLRKHSWDILKPFINIDKSPTIDNNLSLIIYCKINFLNCYHTFTLYGYLAVTLHSTTAVVQIFNATRQLLHMEAASMCYVYVFGAICTALLSWITHAHLEPLSVKSVSLSTLYLTQGMSSMSYVYKR